MDLQGFVKGLPKAELHLHLEGTLEPEMMFRIAERNGIALRHKTVDELRKAYRFSNLQDFLDIYYEGARVLLRERDFYELTYAYLEKARSQGVLHTEMFFDPQTHTSRGVALSTVMGGIERARNDAEDRLGISSGLILCFLRHLPEDSAIQTLHEALPYRGSISAVGLDSSEKGNPPSKFARVFSEARAGGLFAVAHAGEEGPASYVWEALGQLQAKRIDHGNRSADDPELLSKLAEERIPLTMCPLSNLRLGVIARMESHPLKKLMGMGLLVTVNSDDPAYFGGYINENFLAVAEALKLDKAELATLARNSFEASFLDKKKKDRYVKELERYVEKNG